MITLETEKNKREKSMKKNTIIKKYRIAVFALLCIHSWLLSTTITIKQDGSGDFTTIQAGIEASSDADTILVHPGTYYENINYGGKSIIVASLYLTTGNEQYVSQTIIDGNQQARCVTIGECGSVSLIGFTIMHGSALENVYRGNMGGGVYCYNTADALISNNVISYNTAGGGGGLFIESSSTCLRDNRISYNWATEVGGGIDIVGNQCVVEFDSENLNSIYNNYSSTSADLFISEVLQTSLDVLIDTFTVANPDYFYLNDSDLYSFTSLHAKMEEVDHDLYVSPYGSDENTGLTADDPLQTIARAQMLIKRNDANPHTIHLAPGEYSPSLNNQRFPLNVKHGVTIKGESPENTIINAEEISHIVHQSSRNQSEFASLKMENLLLINGRPMFNVFGSCIFIYQSDLSLNNIAIKECYSFSGAAITTFNGFVELVDITITENHSGSSVNNTIEDNCPNPYQNISIRNSSFCYNHPKEDPYFHDGGALGVSGHLSISGDYHAEIINCEFIGNHDAEFDPYTQLGGYTAINARSQISVDIVNCTFTENISDYNGCVNWVDNAEVNIYNSIIYNNEEDYSIRLFENATVDIYNSLLEGGDDNIHYYYPLAIANWHDGNLDADPLWLGSGDYPYMLSDGSPCIDAGTMDLPAGIELPEFDLAGNPRISGDGIDMGAYEYQDSTAVEPPLPKPPVRTSISSYPNPFRPSASRSGGTTIMLELVEEGPITVDIYNIKGQKVLNLMDSTTCPGTYKFSWNGRDAENRQVASGQYFVKVVQQGQTTASKMVMLK
jgi:hypothetical protein